MQSIQTIVRTLTIVALTALLGLYGCADQLADDTGNDELAGPQETGGVNGQGDNVDSHGSSNPSANTGAQNGAGNDGPQGGDFGSKFEVSQVICE